MKLYIEAIEVVEVAEPAVVAARDFIRLATTEERLGATLADLRRILNPRKKYIIQKHFCFHDEVVAQPCRTEVIGNVV